MSIRDFIYQKVIDSILKVEISRMSEAIGEYASKRLPEILQESSLPQSIDSGPEQTIVLGPNIGNWIKQSIVSHPQFIKVLSAQAAQIGLNIATEYYKIPANELPANLTQELALDMINGVNTLKKLFQSLPAPPADVQKWLDGNDYESKVYLNNIAVSLSRDAFVHLIPEFMTKHYTGKLLMWFVSKESISNFLKKFVHKVIPDNILSIDHSKAGIERPTLIGLVTNRATGMWNSLKGIFGLQPPPSDDLPIITKNWLKDNDYPKLETLRGVYKSAYEQVQQLKDESNKLLKQLESLEKDIQGAKLNDFDDLKSNLLKSNLDRVDQDLRLVNNSLRSNLGEFNRDNSSSIENEQRKKDFTDKADQIINKQFTDLKETILKMDAKLHDLRQLKVTLEEDAKRRGHSVVNIIKSFNIINRLTSIHPKVHQKNNSDTPKNS